MSRLREIFAVIGSVGKAFKELGWEVLSLGLDVTFSPTCVAYVLEWDQAVCPL